MTSPYQRSTSDGIGVNDEILQPNGFSLPVLMDLSAFEFEFFSDEEDNCVVVDPTMFSTVEESRYEGERNPTVEDSMVKVSQTSLPSLIPVSLQVSKQTENQSSSIVFEENSTIGKGFHPSSSSSTQTFSNYLADQSTNTMTTTYEDSAVQTDQTDPLSSLPQEVQNISIHKEDNTDNVEKDRLESLPSPPSPSYLKAEEAEKKEESQPPSPSRLQTLSRGNSGYQYVMDPASMKISFMDFVVGDIALFVPVDDKRERWMAFHSNRPHRYLAQESLDSFLAKDRHRAKITSTTLNASKIVQGHDSQGGRERSRILGRIVLIDTHVTSEEFNPYELPIGTVFYICYVEPLLVPKRKVATHR